MLCCVIDLVQHTRGYLFSCLVWCACMSFERIAYDVKYGHDFEIMHRLCVHMIYVYTVLLILIYPCSWNNRLCDHEIASY